MMAAAWRFVEISKEFLDNLLDNSIPEKAKRATKYGTKIFNGKFSCCCFCFFTRQNYELFYKLMWSIYEIIHICDLSRENIPYDIRSNGWTHGKRTDKKRLDKPFETDGLNSWTDTNFFRTFKLNGWMDVIFFRTVKSNGWTDVNFFRTAGLNGWTNANFLRTVKSNA